MRNSPNPQDTPNQERHYITNRLSILLHPPTGKTPRGKTAPCSDPGYTPQASPYIPHNSAPHPTEVPRLSTAVLNRQLKFRRLDTDRSEDKPTSNLVSPSSLLSTIQPNEPMTGADALESGNIKKVKTMHIPETLPYLTRTRYLPTFQTNIP